MSETITQGDKDAHLAAEQAAIDGKWEAWAEQDPEYHTNSSLQESVGQISVDAMLNRAEREHNEALDAEQDLHDEFALDEFFDAQEQDALAQANQEMYDPGHYSPETELE